MTQKQELKIGELKIGELVTIRDYSYTLRLGLDKSTSNGYEEPNAGQQFKVLVTNCSMPTYKLGTLQRVADTIVMGQTDNIVWLVHSCLVERVQPPHVWEHGDVFIDCGNIMIYLNPKYGVHGPQVFYLRAAWNDLNAIQSVNSYLKYAKFLFNIREKL